MLSSRTFSAVVEMFYVALSNMASACGYEPLKCGSFSTTEEVNY